MNALCFALLLAQPANESSLPPTHIQDLIKKRVLFQVKQGNPDLMFYFDEASCTVVGNYSYVQDNLEISSNDRSMLLKFPYSDLLDGKTIETSSLTQLIEAKQNVLAALNAQAKEAAPSGNFQFKKWLPWIAGAVGLSIGGLAIYNSLNHGGDSSGPLQNSRRFQ